LPREERAALEPTTWRLQVVPYFGRDDFRILLNAMAAAEGYKSSTIADEIKKALSVH